jgi:hypothetical protein
VTLSKTYAYISPTVQGYEVELGLDTATLFIPGPQQSFVVNVIYIDLPCMAMSIVSRGRVFLHFWGLPYLLLIFFSTWFLFSIACLFVVCAFVSALLQSLGPVCSVRMRENAPYI